MRCNRCFGETKMDGSVEYCPHCRSLEPYWAKALPAEGPPTKQSPFWDNGVLYDPEDFFTLFTSEEVGRILQVNSNRIVNKWLKDGKLRGKKVGRQWLITKAEVKRFVAPWGF